MVERIRRPIVALVAVAGIGAMLAFVLHEAHASGPTPQLPDLVVDEPDFMSLSVSETTPTGQPDQARLLLRFNGYLHNKGPGALDFRGSREAPPDLSEPAVPKMNAFQRIYGPLGEALEDVPSSAEMKYVDADGHHHWHLQHIAFYSLWNSEESGEVAPAQKVGFCLEDSEHREPGVGPAQAVYSDTVPPYRHFCEEGKPEATSLYEGISAGWRDVYERQLAFQWVDVSDVLPGEYFLHAEADPEKLVMQAPGPKPPVFAQTPTIVPGYDAQAQSQITGEDQPLALTLSAKTWSGVAENGEAPSPNVEYEIVSPPQHGTFTGPLQGSHLTYAPATGYTGTDSFTFAARDRDSAFPKSPAVATVTIAVGEAAPSVAIGGAPASMLAGTSVQFSAAVAHDSPSVTWSASAGSIRPAGLYTAPSTPPAGGVATVAVQTARGARDERRLTILAVPVAQPAPEVPTPLPAPAPKDSPHGPLSTPAAMLIERKLYLTVKPFKTGLLHVRAFVHRRAIGGCSRRVKGGLSYTCAFKLPRWVSRRAAVSVTATLRAGGHLFRTSRHAARVPTAMKAMSAARGSSLPEFARAVAFFCGL